MNARHIQVLPLICWTLCVQPLSAQGLGNAQPNPAPQPAAQGAAVPRIGQSHTDPESGETPNPQILGMEIPLLDPASDTVPLALCVPQSANTDNIIVRQIWSNINIIFFVIFTF